MPSLHTVIDTLQLAVGDMVKGSEELMKYVRYRQQDIEISEIFSRMFEKLKADLVFVSFVQQVDSKGRDKNMGLLVQF